MTNETIPQPKGSSSDTDKARKQRVIQLFFDSNQSLLFALDRQGVCPQDAIRIIDLLAERLHTYRGAPSEPAFQKWATRFALSEAKRFQFTADVLQDHEKVIRSAIRHALKGSGQDWAVTVDDVFLDFARYLFQNAAKFYPRVVDTAKLSTRLYAAAQNHTRLYFTFKRQNRFALVSANRSNLGCEAVYSPEEIAATKWQPAFDREYAELA